MFTEKFILRRKEKKFFYKDFAFLLENVMKCSLEHVNVAHHIQLLEPRCIFDATRLCWVLDSKATVRSRLQAV